MTVVHMIHVGEGRLICDYGMEVEERGFVYLHLCYRWLDSLGGLWVLAQWAVQLVEGGGKERCW